MKGFKKYRFPRSAAPALLGLALTCLACRKTERVVPAETPTTANGGKTLLALGDSYTIGQSVTEADRFPNQTVRWLQAKSLTFSYPATIIAQTGWTTQNLLSAIQTADANRHVPYDAVTLLIGVNNQYQGRDTGEYRTQFTECLNKALFFSGGKKEHVFVLSIPDWGVTPYGASFDPSMVADAIDRFNAINKNVAIQMGVAYIDITPASRQAGADRSLVAGDGLHPSAKQYRLWTELMAPVMEAQLR